MSSAGIRLIGFDADDTLWRSEDYFAAAQSAFERIVGEYIDLDDARARQRLLTIEQGNLALFGYGVKGMALSMIEAAIDITGRRIDAGHVHEIVSIAKDMLRHPVELLPGIRDAVAAIAADYEIVLITKGDLFHQEAKVRQSGLADLFGRIEIVSEKDDATYHRVLKEFGLPPECFCMIGNSLRSDIAPVLRLGGWAVHMPYALTWAHELDAQISPDAVGRMREVEAPRALPDAVATLARLANASGAENAYV